MMHGQIHDHDDSETSSLLQELSDDQEIYARSDEEGWLYADKPLIRIFRSHHRASQ